MTEPGGKPDGLTVQSDGGHDVQSDGRPTGHVQPKIKWLFEHKVYVPSPIRKALGLDEYGNPMPQITVLSTFDTAVANLVDLNHDACTRALSIAQKGSDDYECSRCDALVILIMWKMGEGISPEKALHIATKNKDVNNIWLFVWAVIKLTDSHYNSWLKTTCWLAMLPAADDGFLPAQLQLMSDLVNEAFEKKHLVWREKYTILAALQGHPDAIRALALLYDNKSISLLSMIDAQQESLTIADYHQDQSEMGWWWWVACAHCHPDLNRAAEALRKIQYRKVTLWHKKPEHKA